MLAHGCMTTSTNQQGSPPVLSTLCFFAVEADGALYIRVRCASIKYQSTTTCSNEAKHIGFPHWFSISQRSLVQNSKLNKVPKQLASISFYSPLKLRLPALSCANYECIQCTLPPALTVAKKTDSLSSLLAEGGNFPAYKRCFRHPGL